MKTCVVCGAGLPEEAEGPGLDVKRLGMAMDMVTDEDDAIGVVGRGSYAERVAAKYAALERATR